MPASCRLSYNGSIFAKEGLGYLLTFENLIHANPESGLVFRPLFPALETNMYMIWKKGSCLRQLQSVFCRNCSLRSAQIGRAVHKCSSYGLMENCKVLYKP